MKLLSVKELRLNFPKVRRGLARGERYTLLYRSKPVGEITPHHNERSAYELFAFFARPPFKIRSKKSAVELVREVRGSGTEEKYLGKYTKGK